MIVVDVLQSFARLALTRAFTRYGGHVFVASYKISWWKCRRSVADLRSHRSECGSGSTVWKWVV